MLVHVFSACFEEDVPLWADLVHGFVDSASGDTVWLHTTRDGAGRPIEHANRQRCYLLVAGHQFLGQTSRDFS